MVLVNKTLIYQLTIDLKKFIKNLTMSHTYISNVIQTVLYLLSNKLSIASKNARTKIRKLLLANRNYYETLCTVNKIKFGGGDKF